MENRVAKKPLENIFINGIFKKCGVRCMDRIFVAFDWLHHPSFINTKLNFLVS